MLKIAPIEGGLTGWEWNEEARRLVNPRIGVIQLVSVRDEQGNELYQQPISSENRGEISIIVNDKAEMAFVEAERHAVLPLEAYVESWQEAPNPLDHDSGTAIIELPRGFANALLTEAEEESRYKQEFVAKLGNINANTALFATSPGIVVSRALTIPADRPPDPNERIRQVLWLTPEEVAKLAAPDGTLCGFTLAGVFARFRWWARKVQKDSFWQDIAEIL